MVTKEQAMIKTQFHHVRLTNADGTPVCCRANGKCKIWKKRPGYFRLPVKYGLKYCFSITPDNACDWVVIDEEIDLSSNKDSYHGITTIPGIGSVAM